MFLRQGMVVHTCKLSTQEDEARGLWFGLHRKFEASLNYTVRPCLKKNKTQK
jgi:hypothetical protein